MHPTKSNLQMQRGPSREGTAVDLPNRLSRQKSPLQVVILGNMKTFGLPFLR
jgi:hypothetical protein